MAGHVAKAEHASAQELFGLEIAQNDTSYDAIIRSAPVRLFGNALLRRDRRWRAVVVHQQPVDLSEMQNSTHDFTLLLRSVHKNFNRWLMALETAKRENPNAKYAEYLDSVREYGMPMRAEPSFGRDALVWATAGALIPHGGERTGQLDGDLVTYGKIGTVMRSVIHRTGLDFSGQRLDPLVYAAQTPINPIVWYTGKGQDCHSIGDIVRAYWIGVIDPDRLDELLSLDVDILIRCEVTDGYVYATTIIRADSPVIEGKMPGLDIIARQLRRLGKWDRVTNYFNLNAAFRAFIPGAPPPPAWLRHKVKKSQEVFNTIMATVTQADNIEGDTLIGIDEDTMIGYHVKWSERPSWIIEGPPGAGKSTLANFISCARTMNQFTIEMKVDETAATNRIVKELSDDRYGENDVHVIDLPDAKNEMDEHDRVLAVTEQAKADMDALFAEGRKIGRLRMPYVLRPKVRSALYSAYSFAALIFYVDNWRIWNAETGQECIVRVEDLVAIPPPKPNRYLGDEPMHIGDEAKHYLHELEDTGRTAGITLICTAHAKKELEELWPPGFFESFAAHISVNINNHQYADVMDAKRGIALKKDLRVYLPTRIERVVGAPAPLTS